MKILPVKKECSINSKAYFKQNSNFKTLYGHSEFLYDFTIDEFKRLPNHEIEILELLKQTGQQIKCTVFNNNTKRALDFELSSFSTGLNELMEYLCSNFNCQSYFYKKNEVHLRKYNILSNNDK